MTTFGTEVDDVLDLLPIDPVVIRSGGGRITIESIKVWIGEADAILTRLLNMNGAIAGDADSIIVGRAAIKFYAVSNALRKINNNSLANEYMQMWKTERQVFAESAREVVSSDPTSTQVKSNIKEDVCRKKFGKPNFEW